MAPRAADAQSRDRSDGGRGRSRDVGGDAGGDVTRNGPGDVRNTTVGRARRLCVWRGSGPEDGDGLGRVKGVGAVVEHLDSQFLHDGLSILVKIPHHGV